MAELHKFEDIARNKESRAKPIPARKLDENFTVCRLRVIGPIEQFLKVQDNFPLNDELRFAFDVPTSGTYVMGFVNGVFSLLETEACE